jgi:hypothetical protein
MKLTESNLRDMVKEVIKEETTTPIFPGGNSDGTVAQVEKSNNGVEILAFFENEDECNEEDGCPDKDVLQGGLEEEATTESLSLSDIVQEEIAKFIELKKKGNFALSLEHNAKIFDKELKDSYYRFHNNPNLLNESFFGEAGHLGLDLLGLVPWIGNFADGLNAAWYMSEGRPTLAAIAALCAVPGAGYVPAAAKISQSIKSLMSVGKAGKLAAKGKGIFKGAKAGFGGAKAEMAAAKIAREEFELGLTALNKSTAIAKEARLGKEIAEQEYRVAKEAFDMRKVEVTGMSAAEKLAQKNANNTLFRNMANAEARMISKTTAATKAGTEAADAMIKLGDAKFTKWGLKPDMGKFSKKIGTAQAQAQTKMGAKALGKIENVHKALSDLQKVSGVLRPSVTNIAGRQVLKLFDSKDPKDQEMAQQALGTLAALSGNPTQLATQQALQSLLQYNEARFAGQVPFTPPMVERAGQQSLQQFLRGLSVEDWEKLRTVLNTYPMAEGKGEERDPDILGKDFPFNSKTPNSPFSIETTKDHMNIKSIEDVVKTALKDDIVKYIMKVIIPAFNDLGMPQYATNLLQQFGSELIASQLEKASA